MNHTRERIDEEVAAAHARLDRQASDIRARVDAAADRGRREESPQPPAVGD